MYRFQFVFIFFLYLCTTDHVCVCVYLSFHAMSNGSRIISKKEIERMRQSMQCKYVACYNTRHIYIRPMYINDMTMWLLWFSLWIGFWPYYLAVRNALFFYFNIFSSSSFFLCEWHNNLFALKEYKQISSFAIYIADADE